MTLRCRGRGREDALVTFSERWPVRYWALALVAVLFLTSLPVTALLPWVGGPVLLVSGILLLVGIAHQVQPRQAIRRNYPIIAHLRFFLESIRPEARPRLR